MTPGVVVLGAGAAGLWASIAAAGAGASVLLLEKTHRTGTKILASGGTRCNLTTTLDPAAAARLFGHGERFVTPAMRALPPAEVRRRFHDWGVPTVTEDALEKVFPASQRAIDVRDALYRAAVGAGVSIRTGALVSGIAPRGSGWDVTTPDGDIHTPAVIVAVGGQSYPRTGTTGDGYGWLSGLGLNVVRPVPALVPLLSIEAWVHELAGVSLQRVRVRLIAADGRVVGDRARPVVFTHQGISGPGAMDLAAPVAASPAAGWSLALDLVPGVPQDALRDDLLAASQEPGAPRLARRLAGAEIPARLLTAACRQAGISADNPALHQVERRARNRLVDALKGLLVPVCGTAGWDKAEVTAGGLALDEVDRRSLQVKQHPGLYVVGELLDLTGPIGGLNFQAAFATGELAGAHAARRAASG